MSVPAQATREQELRELVGTGVPLCTVGKSGHWRVGPLHIFTRARRWFNVETGRRGRLNHQSMSQLLKLECYDQLCPEAAKASRQMEILYRKYDQFMAGAARHTEAYEQFMRKVRAERSRSRGAGTEAAAEQG